MLRVHTNSFCLSFFREWWNWVCWNFFRAFLLSFFIHFGCGWLISRHTACPPNLYFFLSLLGGEYLIKGRVGYFSNRRRFWVEFRLQGISLNSFLWERRGWADKGTLGRPKLINSSITELMRGQTFWEVVCVTRKTNQLVCSNTNENLTRQNMKPSLEEGCGKPTPSASSFFSPCELVMCF